jgi:hypothetical protein
VLLDEAADEVTGGIQVSAEASQGAAGNAVPVPDQRQQDVLGSHIAVAEFERLGERELKHLLGIFGEWNGYGRGTAAQPDLPFLWRVRDGST